MEPDYPNYTAKELKEAMDSIDRHRFPERYERIKLLLSQKADEKPADKGKTKLTLKETYLSTAIVVFSFLVLSLIIKAIPMRSGADISLEQQPALFWTFFSLWAIAGIIAAILYVFEHKRT